MAVRARGWHHRMPTQLSHSTLAAAAHSPPSPERCPWPGGLALTNPPSHPSTAHRPALHSAASPRAPPSAVAMEDATLCETADAAPASLGAASESAAKIDQSLTCQSSEKRTRDEGAKPAPTLAKTKRARAAPSPAPAWYQGPGAGLVPWPRPLSEALAGWP